MSRTLSSAALQALFAANTDECLLFLIEIDHSSWANPVRIVNNNIDIVSNGDTYTAFPVEITLPSEHQDKTATSRLRVCNVDRQMVSLFDALSSSPSVTVSVVLGPTPDTSEAGPGKSTLEDYTYTKEAIEGVLSHENLMDKSFPSGTFSPGEYEGLF